MTNFQKCAALLSSQNGILVDGFCQSYTYQETHLLKPERIVYNKHLTKEQQQQQQRFLKNASELIAEEDRVRD